MNTATAAWHLDIAIFVILLTVTLPIGIYHGFFDGRDKSVNQYLFAGRALKSWTVGLSLIVSYLTPAVLLLTPVEIYSCGTAYIVVFVPTIFLCVVFILTEILEIFYVNNIDNCYTLRFGRSLRDLISADYVMHALLLLPILVDVSALTQLINGADATLIIALVYIVFVLSTMLGGLKAVVWTGVVQGTVMMASMLMLIVYSGFRVGGLGAIYGAVVHGDRLHVPLMRFTVTTQTLWSLMSKVGCSWLMQMGMTQSNTQRLMALPSLQSARRVLIVCSAGLIACMLAITALGLIMYTFYATCDPLQTGSIPVTLVSRFVIEMVNQMEGMRGLLVACVFIASFSSFSVHLNTVAGIIYHDYVCKIKGITHSYQSAVAYMRVITLILGSYCIFLGPWMASDGSIHQLLNQLTSISTGPVFGVFTLGMFCAIAHNGAASVATIVSMLTMAWLSFGTRWYQDKFGVPSDRCSSSTDGCAALNEHVLVSASAVPAAYDTFSVYQVTEQWYPLLGALLVWLIGLPLSYVLPRSDKVLDERLLSSFLRRINSGTSRACYLYCSVME